MVLCKVGISSNVETGAMHLIGKLILVKSVLPLNNFLPIILPPGVQATAVRAGI